MEEFDDIVEDIRDMASHYGQIKSIHVPKPPIEEEKPEIEPKSDSKSSPAKKDRKRRSSREKDHKSKHRSRKSHRKRHRRHSRSFSNDSRDSGHSRDTDKSEKNEEENVPKVKVPKPRSPGQGHVFLEYITVDAAKNARVKIMRKLFRGRAVEARYHEEHRYLMQDYNVKLGYL